MIKQKTFAGETLYLLEEQDVKSLKYFVNYCWHRAKKHGKQSAGSLEELNRLREEFEIVNSEKEKVTKEAIRAIDKVLEFFNADNDYDGLERVLNRF